VTIHFHLALFSTALLSIPLGNAHAQSAERAPDTMAARVLACAPCHGDKGQGTKDDYFPRLAGKPAGYLYNQLVAFWDGRRKYPPMNYLLEFLPDPYLKAMADYFASEQPPFPPPATPTVSSAILARGEMLATKGDPTHEISRLRELPRAVLYGYGAGDIWR
jgi:cytochrome c553